MQWPAAIGWRATAAATVGTYYLHLQNNVFANPNTHSSTLSRHTCSSTQRRRLGPSLLLDDMTTELSVGWLWKIIICPAGNDVSGAVRTTDWLTGKWVSCGGKLPFQLSDNKVAHTRTNIVRSPLLLVSECCVITAAFDWLSELWIGLHNKMQASVQE